MGLWQRDKNSVVAQFRNREQRLPQQFVLAYSEKLNQLAISGTEQAVHVLDGSTLSLIHSPDLAAGTGCTHLAWAGVDGDFLFAGDTEGIIRAANFSGGLHPGIDDYEFHTPLAGIVASSDGREVFVITTTGRLRCFDAATGRSLCDLRISETDLATQIQSSVFNSTDQHLALFTESGDSVILHGPKPKRAARPKRVAIWQHKTLWKDRHVDWIRTRQEAVRLTADDQLTLLYSTRDKDSHIENLWIARADVKQFSRHSIAETDLTGLKDHRDYERSVALLLDKRSIRGVYRQRIPEDGGYAGGVNGIEWNHGESMPQVWFENVVTGNLGFENHITTDDQGRHQILTFEHASRGLLLIDPQTASLQRIGRQGDGLYFHAVSQEGLTDVVSIPNRLNSEPFRVWHYTIETSSNPATTQRRVIDPHYGARPLAVLRHGSELLTLIRRPGQQRRVEYLLLRENENERMESQVPVPASPNQVSNLCLTAEGRCLFAYIDPNAQLILCEIDSAGATHLELISESPLQETFRTLSPQCLVLRLTSEGQPLICFVADGPNGSSISTYLRREQ